MIKQLRTDFYPIYILDSLIREAARTSDDLATSKPGGTRSHRVSSGRDERSKKIKRLPEDETKNEQ